MRLFAWMNRVGPHPATYFDEREDSVPPMAEEGLPPDEITIAELLRTRGSPAVDCAKLHRRRRDSVRRDSARIGLSAARR